MDSTYTQALNGTLYAAPTGSEFQITVSNQLPIPVILYQVQSNGTRVLIGTVNMLTDIFVSDQAQGDYIYVAAAYSGAFVSVISVVSGTTTYPIDYGVLCDPNDVGEIPEPSRDIMVPQDTPLVMVACGTMNEGQTAATVATTVTREQYWTLLGDSYSLSPGEVRQVSYTVISGRQVTSSTEASISASLGMSGSAGWGPISASLSASLNMSASVSQQVSVNQETTSYISDTLSNDGTAAMLVYRWQLMDQITLFNAGGTPIGSVVSGLAPIVAKPVDPASVPETLVRTPVLEKRRGTISLKENAQ